MCRFVNVGVDSSVFNVVRRFYCFVCQDKMMWAVLAGMALNGQQLDDAEIALAAIDEVPPFSPSLYCSKKTFAALKG